MVKILVKPSRDEDFYVLWSETVDAPLTWGTRAQIIEHRDLGPETEERVARTDENGTSALWPKDGPFAYCYDDDVFIYQQRGILRRHRLKEACLRLEKDEEADLSDLLEPFEDD